MIQDIYPHKLHNEYQPNVKVVERSIVLNIYNGKILVYAEKFANHIIKFPMKKDTWKNFSYGVLFAVDYRLYDAR